MLEFISFKNWDILSLYRLRLCLKYYQKSNKSASNWEKYIGDDNDTCSIICTNEHFWNIC